MKQKECLTLWGLFLLIVISVLQTITFLASGLFMFSVMASLLGAPMALNIPVPIIVYIVYPLIAFSFVEKLDDFSEWLADKKYNLFKIE